MDENWFNIYCAGIPAPFQANTRGGYLVKLLFFIALEFVMFLCVGHMYHTDFNRILGYFGYANPPMYLWVIFAYAIFHLFGIYTFVFPAILEIIFLFV